MTGLPPETDCNDMLDNDCNGLIDCADPACAGVAPCAPVRRDPSVIKFGPAGRGLDLFQAEGWVAVGPIDITRVEVDWLLTNSKGAIYRGALIPGDLVSRSTGRVFRFSDPGARTGNGKRFGIYAAQVKKLRDGSGYSFKIRAYGDLSAATEPDMDFQVYMGDLRPLITSGKLWVRTPWGWRAPRDH